MPRTGEALGQRTSNCRDRYFAVRLYIELKTVPPQRKAAAMATTEMPVARERVAAAEIEMPYLEDEKGASGWSAVGVRSRKNLPGNKRGYCLREHQAVSANHSCHSYNAYPRFHVSRTRIPSRGSGKLGASVPGWTCAM